MSLEGTKENAPSGNSRHQTQTKPNLSRNATPFHNVKQGGIQNILSRLDKVRPSGKGKWMACCPAHADKSPSLTLHETPDGTVLLHCFGGCSAHDVVAAVGLELTDLFPPRQTNVHAVKGQRGFDAYTALKCLADDINVALIASRMLSRGEQLEESDIKRLAESAGRFQEARTFVLGAV